MGLTQGFVLRRMGVDVRRHITRVRFPAVDQLRFTDQFADSRADHVHAHHWTAGSANELDEACGLEDPRFPVTSEVVGQRLDLPVGCSGSFLDRPTVAISGSQYDTRGMSLSLTGRGAADSRPVR